MKKNMSEKEILETLLAEGLDPREKQNMKAARERVNKLTGSRWAKSRFLTPEKNLWILETPSGMGFREFRF